MSQSKSREMAKNLLLRFKIKRTPIPIEKIAKELGIYLESAILEEKISGFLYRDAEKSIIAVNRLHPPTRQRFTTAHEIGHLVLNHEGNFFIDRGLINYRDSKSSTGEDLQEREANAFAAELLMPEDMLKRDFRKEIYDIENPESMEKLANKYKVSVQALTFRLVNLGIVG